MKFNSETILWNVGVFIWSIFMGVTAVSIGLGAAFPPINLIAKPILCPRGQMTYEESTSNPMPGTSITQIGWYCVDGQSETATPLDIFSIALVAGPIYGLLIEAIVLIAQWFRGRNVTASQTVTAYTRQNRVSLAKDSVARMKELKELHAQGMISEAEYEQKRDEILKDL
jgi:uncharacterized membrane protein